MAKENKQPINTNTKGLNIISSPEFQPEGTSRFNLNTVNESENGDILILSNERSTTLKAVLPDNLELINDIYIGNGNLCIFSVNEFGVSEIGIFNEYSMQYETVINDSASLPTEKLNFSKDFFIDATFRLRRGCERTVYFTDYNSSPRVVNLDNPDRYKNAAGRFDSARFNLQRLVNEVPLISNISVLDYGGSLAPGSYNIAIQYLDENFNATEYVASSDVIMIYNDDTSKNFIDIKGSVKLVQEDNFLDFPLTTKSISVVLDNLDTSFPFYRIAVIEASTGSGRVSKVSATDVIPTSKTDYILTGLNTPFNTTEAEIKQVSNIIEKARHIKQIDNTLILGDTQGSQINFCELQKYASRINTDLIVKKVFINSMDDINNPKSPVVNIGGNSYMPGEIYALGIVYVFEGNVESPVLHIPGKPSRDSNSKVYKPGPNVYGMSNNNMLASTLYTSNEGCTDFWGTDGGGARLENRRVRHHRFPFRRDLGLPLVREEDSNTSTRTFYIVKFKAEGTIELSTDEITQPVFSARLNYEVDGEQFTSLISINPSESENPIFISVNSQRHLSSNINIISIVEDANDGNEPVVVPQGEVSPKGVTYTSTIEPIELDQSSKIYSTDIFGLQFSNIELPPASISNGKKCLGYYIVRAERTLAEKTILDSAILTPSLKNSKYVSHGLLAPELNDEDFNTRIDNNIFGVINPEYKFRANDVRGFTEIVHEGNFKISQVRKSKIAYQDVVEGTSYDSDNHDKSDSDDDGFDLTVAVRDNEVVYEPYLGKTYGKSSVEDLFYLDALDFKDINLGEQTIYNIAGDNKVGIIRFKESESIDKKYFRNSFPYVVFKRENANPYSNFRNIEFYKENTNIQTQESVSIYGGDSYVSPMRYVNTVFWENRLVLRKGKSGFWKKVLGVIAIVAAVVLSIFTFGAGTALIAVGAGLLVAGAGTLMLSSGIKQDKWNKAYNEEYEKGLRETALDDYVKWSYKSRYGTSFGPGDDTIQWVADCITDFWFQTSVNTNLRLGTTTGLPTHLPAPGIRESGNTTTEQLYHKNDSWRLGGGSLYPMSDLEFHLAAKLLFFDPNRKDSRKYYGHSLGEYYYINEDYFRRNTQKVHFGLGLEYECCSECREVFSQRVHYSLQSFQEELSDNYNTFLPNNYKDMPGEFGSITNLFTMGNNLFIHTEEALYIQPRNYQERVTDQIVSFIGTGSLFEVPPQIIIDSDGYSGGTTFKSAYCKTPYGYFFASNQGLFRFNGKSLENLSDKELKPYFDKNLKIYGDSEETNQEHISFYSNPDNVRVNSGVGYSLGYDSLLKRVLFTKIDTSLNEEVNYSFTVSFCLKIEAFLSFHSYFPTHYLKTSDSFFGYSRNLKGQLWKFNTTGKHNNYFGQDKPTIMEYVVLSNPLQEEITNSITVNAAVQEFDENQNDYFLNSDKFFDKVMLYNSYQNTGIISITNKNTNVKDFFGRSIKNPSSTQAEVERVGGNWHLNNFRNLVIDTKVPMFVTKLSLLSSYYFIDKLVNQDSINYNKPWDKREVLRDKYLIVRFIFDKFANEKITLKIATANQSPSIE